MLVAVAVVDKPLFLRGSTHPVGERIMLDPSDPQHQEVLDRGWARPLDASTSGVSTATAAVDAPPTHKMVVSGNTKAAQPLVAPTKKPQKKG